MQERLAAIVSGTAKTEDRGFAKVVPMDMAPALGGNSRIGTEEENGGEGNGGEKRAPKEGGRKTTKRGEKTATTTLIDKLLIETELNGWDAIAELAWLELDTETGGKELEERWERKVRFRSPKNRRLDEGGGLDEGAEEAVGAEAAAASTSPAPTFPPTFPEVVTLPEVTGKMKFSRFFKKNQGFFRNFQEFSVFFRNFQIFSGIFRFFQEFSAKRVVFRLV